MKQHLTLFFILFSISLFAQPSNDDCVGLIDLGDAPICDSTLYNNVGATESNIGADNFPPCFIGVPDRDVWFAFTTVDTILNYRITLTGSPDPALGLSSIVNPQIAVYRGECLVDELQLLDCVSAAPGETTVTIDLDNLTPGLPYFLRINDWSSTATPNSGAFKLCVTKQPPISTVDEGGSTACSGTLTDSGGPDGDYGNNENFVFSICPNTPTGCITFNMEYFNIESGDFFAPAEVLSFYDGPNTSSPLIATLDGSSSNFASNGGVCYSVTATSGCLTVQFISDGTATYEGFLGYWECSADDCPPNQNLEVTTGASPEEIVESVVFGQTLINVLNVDCANSQLGTFIAGPDSELGLEKGLVLTSGTAAGVGNPSTVFNSAIINEFQSDPDLDYLSTISGNGSVSEDACIVELEVYATGNEITFEYVFGSEEYPEYANTTFNDIFAFLVSGPGIAGDPNIGNQLNIATLPDGTFVQINGVNDGMNWQYYRNNNNGQTIVYDGLTSDSMGVKKSLTARLPTIPCNFYKLKFAIADRGDSSFDSGVFIAEINGGWPEIGVNYQNGIDYLVEECTAAPDELNISIDAELDQPVEVDVVVGGSAIPGVDYTLNLPPNLTFTTGSEIFTFPIQVISDGIAEGLDTITIDLVQNLSCGATPIASIVLVIHDQLEVEIFDNEVDTVIVCAADPSVELEAVGGANYVWSPANIFSNNTIANPIATVTQDQWVTVQGSLGICTDIDSIFLDFTNVQVEIMPGGPITACQGDTVTLTAVNTVNNANLFWSSFPVPQDPTNPVQKVSPPQGVNFVFMEVAVGTGGCIATDNISLTFNPYDLPEVAGDTTICENYSVDLGSDITSFTTTYQWSPADYLTPGPDVSGPIATPEETTTYTLITNGSNGACQDTFELTITVIPADIEVLNPDTVFICVGDTATLNNTSSTAGAGVSWQPQVYMTQVSTEQVKVYPPVSTWYYAVLETANCSVTDSVLVYVDSLPDLSIMAVPAKDSYCQGEEVTLITETYEPSNFPAIDFTWEEPTPGALTPDSFLNLVFLAVETHTFVRTTTVNACTSTDSIHIEVVPVASIMVTPSQADICQGESVDLVVTGDPGITEFTWSPAQGLSCSDCANPTATPQVTTTYQIDAEFDGCPVGTTATINVSPGPGIIFPIQTTICPGQSVVLNEASDPNATYVWTSSDGTLNSTEAQPVVNPTQTTTYFVTASRGACTVTREITIFIGEDFTVTIEPVSVLCGGESVTLVAVVEGTDNPSYQWANDNGEPLGNGATLDTGPLTTTTNFFVTVVDAGGCHTHTESVTVEVSTLFTISVPDTVNALQGEDVTITATIIPSGLNLNYEWMDGTLLVGTDPSITVNSCSPKLYTLLVTDENGCTQTDQVFLNIEAGFVLDDLTYMNVSVDTSENVYEGQEIVLIAHTTPAVIPGATYDWFINGVLVSTTNDTISETINAPEVDADSLFDISVLITSTSGCALPGQDTMTVFDNPVQLPNAFSPNNDGENDFFLPIAKIPVNIVDFKVWNRWGQLVYDNERGMDGWDGKQDGDDAPSDVYIYYIQYEIMGGTTGLHKPLKGDVTLLR